jgi:hypothetical protein
MGQDREGEEEMMNRIGISHQEYLHEIRAAEAALMPFSCKGHNGPGIGSNI